MSTELETLRAAWRAANDRLVTAPSRDLDAAEYAEQRTWDALVDYVEANDLNGTPDDPRAV